MSGDLAPLGAALRNSVTRGKVTGAKYILDAHGNPIRTILSAAALASEQFKGVELILPYGFSALPTPGNVDLIFHQALGTRDHKVAFGADSPALRIPDLQLNEFGHRQVVGGAFLAQVVFRNNKLEVTAGTDADGNKIPVVVLSQGNIQATSTQGDVDVTALEGNVNVLADAGTITAAAGAQKVILSQTDIMTLGKTYLGCDAPGDEGSCALVETVAGTAKQTYAKLG